MGTTASRLDAAIRAAGVAIAGVSVGDEADRTTWKVQPASLQAAAQPTIDAYVDPTAAILQTEAAQILMADKRLRAVAEALWELVPAYAGKLTKAQALARAIEIYKTL